MTRIKGNVKHFLCLIYIFVLKLIHTKQKPRITADLEKVASGASTARRSFGIGGNREIKNINKSR